MALIAAYAFDEGQGSIAAEADGGVALTGIPAWATGRHGSSLYVNGVPGVSVTPWATDTAFTVMLDVYRINAAGYTVFLNDWENQGDSVFGNVQVGQSGLLEWYLGCDTTTPIPVGEWTNIALTGDGVWRRAYVNGTQAGAASNTNRSGTGPVVLGGFAGFHPNVRIDNVRFFNTALTQAEIADLAGTPVGPAVDPAPVRTASLTGAGALAASVASVLARAASLGSTSSLTASVVLLDAPPEPTSPTKYVPPGFNRDRVLQGIKKAMGFGAATRPQDRVTFYFNARSAPAGEVDEEGVPFDPADRVTNTREGESKVVDCAVEYQDRAPQTETFGVYIPARIILTLLDPDWQQVKDFSYVKAGGDIYHRSTVEPPVALGSIDVWSVICLAEGES